jgi:branched-chain amino acid transport system substrate-binding protein
MRAYLFLAAILALLSQQLFAQAAPQPIKIGCVLYLTGDLAMQENGMREGLELAMEEIRRRGGILGREVKLLLEDTKNEPKLGITAAHRFLNIEKVSVVLLSSYQDAMASGPLYERAKTPALVLWDSSPEIDRVGDYVFAIGPWIPSAGEAAADYSFHQLKARRVVTINTNEQWSQGVTEYFKKRFAKLGGEIIESMAVNPEDQDFRTVIARAKHLKPDLLYTPLVYSIVPFYTQLYQAQVKVPIVSSDIITDEHIKQAPAALEGVYQASIADPDTPLFKDLQERYARKYGRPLTQPWFVATGYDGLMLVAQAISRAGTDGTAIKDEFYRIKDYKGAGRTFSFSAAGSSPDYENMFQIREGRFVRVGQ